MGVVAATGTTGGSALGEELVSPTMPVSTATSTASPTPATAQASTHALRSEGGLGTWAPIAAGIGGSAIVIYSATIIGCYT